MSTDTESAAPAKKKFEFPGSITVLALVTVVVWLAALVIPSGRFATDEDGAPIPGSFEQIDSPLTFGERVRELILSPVNGLYGIQDPISGFVDPDNLGAHFLDFQRQSPVPAADIEDMLPRLRIEQVECGLP